MRLIGLVLALSLTLAPLAAEAQQGGKVLPVGVLRPTSPTDPLTEALYERWSAEAWHHVRVEFKKAIALRSQIRRAGWFK